MQAQDRVACFCDEHDLDAAKSAEYGAAPEDLAVTEDELGDALFALLATAEALDIDAEAALETSLAKYERRLDATGEAGSDAGEAGDGTETDESGSGGE